MNQIKIWIEAGRLRTIPASVVPVLVGSSLAYAHNQFYWDVFVVAMICSMLFQLTSNFTNDVYDFRRGADEERVGPKRLVASGVISQKAMITAIFLTASISFVLGMYLVYLHGYTVLLIGISSLFFAWMYTGGPYPLAYNGLGDIFVFLFFGVVAVCGTYFVHTGHYSHYALLCSISPGLLAANILSANNIRDRIGDAKIRKNTLAVLLGDANSRKLYKVVLIVSYLSVFVLFLLTMNPYHLLPFISIPLGRKLWKSIDIAQGAELTTILVQSAALLMIFGVLQSIGFIIKTA